VEGTVTPTLCRAAIGFARAIAATSIWQKGRRPTLQLDAGVLAAAAGCKEERVWAAANADSASTGRKVAAAGVGAFRAMTGIIACWVERPRVGWVKASWPGAGVALGKAMVAGTANFGSPEWLSDDRVRWMDDDI